MKKILLCSEFYYPNIGGVEHHNKILFEYFKKKKMKIFIATSYHPERINKSNIFEFKVRGNFVRGYSGDTIKYQNFLLKQNFDIIFFNAAQQWSFDLALPIIEKIKSKKILFPCGFSRLRNFLYFPYFKIIKNKINNFDKIICSNKSSIDYRFIKKFYKKKIFLINNGSNKPILKYNRKRILKNLKISPKSIIFMNVSNIKFNKGQGRVIFFFNKIPIQNSVLFLMGQNHSNVYFYYIRILVLLFNRLNHKKKIFFHNSNEDIKKKLYYVSNYFLFGSRIEYDPLVMYEAIVNNTKFISYDIGSCKTIIKSNTGFVSDNDDEKIKYLLENIKKKNKQNKNNVKRFFWDNICKKYYKIFNS